MQNITQNRKTNPFAAIIKWQTDWFFMGQNHKMGRRFACPFD
ncbi:hypothetical protein [Alysiella filiformis]|nr:hypothetical protein [Alysiella filiformis]